MRRVRLRNLAVAYPTSLIPLLSIVRLAEHLTIVRCRRATLAPCRDMVSVHILETPYPLLIFALAEGASWAVRDPMRLSLLRLTLVGTLLRRVVKETYLQKLWLHFAYQ